MAASRRRWWLMAAIAAGWFLLFFRIPGLYRFVGINHPGPWFLDTFAILASNDAVSLGRDPWAVNPLDPFGRAHVYSHWWLHLRDLGLTRADNFWVGLALVGAFFAAALPRLRPRSASELGWTLAVLGAAPVLLAVNRANNDLAVFVVLAPVAALLQRDRPLAGFAAAGLIGVAAGLKFYPAIAGLVLLAGTEARAVRRQVLAGLVGLALVGASVAPDLAKFAGVAPKAEGLMTFGAVNVFAAAGLGGVRALVLGWVLAALVVAVFLRARWFDGWVVAPADREEWLSFVLGAALLTGCFLSGTNFGYRWVFALWLAPLLWRLPRDPAAPARVRGLARAAGGLLLVALWADPLVSAIAGGVSGFVSPVVVTKWAGRFFLLEQLFTWALFACLLGFLAHFARTGVRTLFGRA